MTEAHHGPRTRCGRFRLGPLVVSDDLHIEGPGNSKLPTWQSGTASRLNSPVNVRLFRFLMDHPRRFLAPSRASTEPVAGG